MFGRFRRRRSVPVVLVAILVAVLSSTVASAAEPEGDDHGQPSPPAVPTLTWAACGDANAECATAAVPLDYDSPRGTAITLALVKVPAQNQSTRIGSLFINPGGPCCSFNGYLKAAGAGFLEALNQRFDLVSFDPRGTGESEPSIDCQANQETEGIYSLPYAQPLNLDKWALLGKVSKYTKQCHRLNGEILRHVSTANVARDLDLLRQAVGDPKLSYLGFSYGTFLGATYASLFPNNFRALVLDGPVDANQYINHPSDDLFAQSGGFERALGRLFQACAVDQTACSGFGGADPWQAFDALVAQADASPIPADGYTPDPRPITGDDILNATISDLYAKPFWGELTHAWAAAAAGDGSEIRLLSDSASGREADGTFGPDNDRYFTIGATEQRYSHSFSEFFQRGDASWNTFEHFWFNAGYVELNYAAWRDHDRDAFYGPFRVKASAPSPLVVATTYDPATPYRGALALVKDLGNARLLTMDGDGHTAYGGNTPCIDTAVENYLIDLVVPPVGTRCQQEVPFTAPAAANARAAQPAAPDLTRMALDIRTRAGH